MKTTDLRKKSVADLQQQLEKTQEELSQAAREQRTGEQTNVRHKRNLRKTIARIKTVINEENQGEEK